MSIKINCKVEYGKPDEKEKIKQSAMQKIVDQIAALLEAASKLKSDDKMDTWFGEDNRKKGKSEIASRLGQLIEYVDKATIVFKTRDTRTGIAYSNLATDEPIIFLQKPFRYKRIIWGEKVVSIVHELAHKCKMKARDLGGTYFGSGIGIESSCSYGPKNAKELASQQNDKALKNAENWGYYVCSYFKEANLSEQGGYGDWKFGALSQGGSSTDTQDDPRIVGWEDSDSKSVEKKIPPKIPDKTKRPPKDSLRHRDRSPQIVRK